MIVERAGGVSGQGRRNGKFRNGETKALQRKVAYLVSADPRFEGLPPGRRVARVHGVNVMPCLRGDDPERYAEDFIAALEQWNQERRGQRAASQYLCIDRSISFAPDDPVDPDKAISIAQELVQGVMNDWEDRFALYVVHTDKHHLHVHVIASVVGDQGRIFNPHRDDRDWEHWGRLMEQKHGLQQLDGSLRRLTNISPKYSSPKKKRGTAIRRTPQKNALREAIESAVTEAEGNFQLFLEALDRHNIQPMGHQRGKGPDAPVTGISFYGDGEYFTGSQLSRDLAWPTLRERVGYDPAQHQASLLEHTQQYQAASQVLCTIKPVSPTAMGSGVIELPEVLDMRKQQLLQLLQTEPNHEASGSSYRWSTGSEVFRENAVIVPPTGARPTSYGRYLCVRRALESGSNLSTENGSKRSVIKCMLVRAWQLGWGRLVVEGSKEFVKLAKALCRDWLGGRVHDRQPRRANDPKAAAITTSPSTPPIPDPLVLPHSRDNDLRMEPGRASNMKPRTTVTPSQKPRRVEEEPAVEVVGVPVEPSLEEEPIPEVVIEPDSPPDPLNPFPPTKPDVVPLPVKEEGSPDRTYPDRGRRRVSEPDSGPSM